MIGFRMLALGVLGVGAALAFAPTQGMAATCSIGSGATARIFTLDAASTAQCLSGNDTGAMGIQPADTVVGFSGWILADKSNEVAGDQSIVITTDVTATPWTWTLATAHTFDKIMITVKDATSFGAFLVSFPPLNGTFSVERIQQGQGPNAGQRFPTEDFSHASVWYIGKDTTVIPLPAAAWLLLSGIGGIALLGRRRRAVA